MIDIIVIMNSDLLSLIKTLGSISFQNSKDINNTIIINNTDIDLGDKLKIFENLDIKIIDCKKENPKNCGIDNSVSPFLLFINSGDLLYNCFSISSVLENCMEYDIITGKIAIGYGNKIDYYDDMNRYTYGKVYSREFINNNKIRFADTKYFSDMAFNKLFLICKPNTALCSREVYFTYNPIDDDNNKDFIIDYCTSFEYCIKTAIENELDERLISNTLYSNMLYLYNKYNNCDKKITGCILKNGKKLYNYYKDYNTYLTYRDKDTINSDYLSDSDYICSFEEFLDMFTVKDK